MTKANDLTPLLEGFLPYPTASTPSCKIERHSTLRHRIARQLYRYTIHKHELNIIDTDDPDVCLM